MGQLKILPAQLANMIAAGEVVQRPASVVKELMENAVDAGADQITVAVTDAGRTLIQVIDNGCGMSPADAVLCFERHATSKISTAEDLEGILTYGFRGEALASIAAVSDVVLKTRRAKDETATKVTLPDSGKVESSSVAAPVGSSFSIRNLFYNTPARRKFLKSDNVELKHIVEEFTRVAITRPDVGFTLTSNGRELFVLKKAKSLKFRILDLLGSNVAGDVVDISAQTSIVNVSGFVGRPDTARKAQSNQYLFVNGRYFRSPYFHKAVMKAYEEMIPDGVTPPYFIFLETDPGSIDVNIHPTKTEIKFEEESVVFQILYACVKETLGRNCFGASIDFETEGAVELPQLGGSFSEYRPVSSPDVQPDPDYDPFDSTPDAVSTPSFGAYGGFPSHVDRSQDYGKLFEEKFMPSMRTLVLHGKYILTPASSGLMMINLRRALERVMYDRALRAVSSGTHVTQNALFPVDVTVGVQERLLFEDNAETLARLGFDIRPCGNDAVTVGGVPEGYSCEEGKIRQLVSDIVYILSDGGSTLTEVFNQRMAEKFASLGASNADLPDTPQEAQRLIDTLFASSNAELTPGGLRIISILPLEEIDKRF